MKLSDATECIAAIAMSGGGVNVTNVVACGLAAGKPLRAELLRPVNKFGSAWSFAPNDRHTTRISLLYFPKSNKFVISGAHSIVEALQEANKYFEVVLNIKITNIVGVGTLEKDTPWDLNATATNLPFLNPAALITYEPERFCGLTYRPFGSKSNESINFFRTGKAVFTGFKTAEELQAEFVIFTRLLDLSEFLNDKHDDRAGEAA